MDPVTATSLIAYPQLTANMTGIPMTPPSLSSPLTATETETATDMTTMTSDELDYSQVESYKLEIIDPNRPTPVPYWYDSPHFRPDA